MPAWRSRKRAGTKSSGNAHRRAASRQQFDIPVEIVTPALVKVIRREGAAMLLKLPAGRPDRLALDLHVRFAGGAPALAEVAGGAGGRDIFPHCAPAVRARNDVVEGQLPARAAIDATKTVAEEQVESREGRIFVRPHELPERDHTRQLERDAGRVNLALIMGDHVDALEKHRLDRGLPRP